MAFVKEPIKVGVLELDSEVKFRAAVNVLNLYTYDRLALLQCIVYVYTEETVEVVNYSVHFDWQ